MMYRAPPQSRIGKDNGNMFPKHEKVETYACLR